MESGRISLKKTVYIDKASGNICHCQGDFYKACPLRVASQLDCKEAIMSVTFIDRDPSGEKASESVRELDESLKDLIDPLKDLVTKIK